MRFLADENVEFEIVAWLREQGHDVFWAAELTPAAADEDLIHRAKTEERVLVTNDLDFGELVFRRRVVPAAILLLRFRQKSALSRLRSLREHWAAIQERLPGHFVVLTETRMRVRPLP